MAADFDHDVLVVGLGPVGAALAALLAQAGVSVLAVERDTEVYPLPRAAHFDHEVMRLLQQLGLAEDMLNHVRPAPAYEFRNAEGAVLLHYPFDGGRTVSGWASGYMIHQPTMERALRAWLGRSSRVTTRLGCSLIGMAQDGEGVSATLSGGGGSREVRTRYLIGCDGARSRVRESLGIDLDDYGFDEPWLVLDVAVGDATRLPDINLQICDPRRPTTCVLMGPGRHRWEFMLMPGETSEAVLKDAFIADLLQPWACADAVTVERKAVYRFHGLVARSWRVGRIFLAGDAAHQTPPFAGQGMCTGLRDAANLAWKLAAVLHGEARDVLLDTYQPEREPQARAVIAIAIQMGRVVCATDPAVAAERDRAMITAREGGARPPNPAPLALDAGLILAGSPEAGEIFPQVVAETAAGPRRLDDDLGPGAWLISRESCAEPAPGVIGALSLRSTNDPDLAAYAASLSSWLDARGAQAVLVRPDRRVFGCGPVADLALAYRRGLRGDSDA